MFLCRQNKDMRNTFFVQSIGLTLLWQRCNITQQYERMSKQTKRILYWYENTDTKKSPNQNKTANNKQTSPKHEATYVPTKATQHLSSWLDWREMEPNQIYNVLPNFGHVSYLNFKLIFWTLLLGLPSHCRVCFVPFVGGIIFVLFFTILWLTILEQKGHDRKKQHRVKTKKKWRGFMQKGKGVCCCFFNCRLVTFIRLLFFGFLSKQRCKKVQEKDRERCA